jgi:hypothetical protein
MASHTSGNTKFKNRVPRRIRRPKREEVITAWRKFRNEGFHYLYFPPSINRVISTRRLRLEGR